MGTVTPTARADAAPIMVTVSMVDATSKTFALRWANERPEPRRTMLRSWISEEFGIAIEDQDIRRDRDGTALIKA